MVRNNPKRSETSSEQKEHSHKVLEQSELSNKNGGFVMNINEAIEMEKKIFSFVTNTMKPNYFILNNAKRSSCISNPNDNSDILINTKAYLKESLDLK